VGTIRSLPRTEKTLPEPKISKNNQIYTKNRQGALRAENPQGQSDLLQEQTRGSLGQESARTIISIPRTDKRLPGPRISKNNQIYTKNRQGALEAKNQQGQLDLYQGETRGSQGQESARTIRSIPRTDKRLPGPRISKNNQIYKKNRQGAFGAKNQQGQSDLHQENSRDSQGP